MNEAKDGATTSEADALARTIAEWEAEEQAVRSRLGAVGVSRPEQLASMSGLELFERMFSGALPSAPIAQTLGFLPIRVERGHTVFQGRPARAYYNPLGTVHGGWFATLLDTVVACAVHSTLPAGKAYTTLELKVNMVRALTDRVPLVRAEGHVIHVGGQVGTAEGRIVGPDGKLYAHASTTCLIFDART